MRCVPYGRRPRRGRAARNTRAQAMKIYVARGGDPANLIEPVDGFHPGQLGQALSATYLWGLLQKRVPHWLPPVNPHNADIVRVFGDQGGY